MKKRLCFGILFFVVVGVFAFLLTRYDNVPATNPFYEQDDYSVEDFVVTNHYFGFEIPASKLSMTSKEIKGNHASFEMSLSDFSFIKATADCELVLRDHLAVEPTRKIYQKDELTSSDFTAQIVYEDGRAEDVAITGFGSDNAQTAVAGEDVLFNTPYGVYSADFEVIDAEKIIAAELDDELLEAGTEYELPDDYALSLVFKDETVRNLSLSDVDVVWENGSNILKHGANTVTFKWGNVEDSHVVNALGEPIIQSDEFPMHYKDLETEITVTKERHFDTDCFVAHIITSNPVALKTTYSEKGNLTHDVMSNVAAYRNAILMINGAFDTERTANPIVRNGEIIVDRGWPNPAYGQMLAMNKDGHFYEMKTKIKYEMADNGLWHCWNFWNGFTIKNGERIVKGDGARHPRTFVGEVLRDDGLLEYYFIVANGRKAESIGLTHDMESEIMAEKGCYVAYNLDGGGSSEMMFNGKILNSPSDGQERQDVDFIYFEMWEGVN